MILKLKDYIKKADIYFYADAIGICIAMKFLHSIEQERIPGYEFHFDVLRLCIKWVYCLYDWC